MPRPPSYDGQAKAYDDRTGLTAPVCREIALAILRVARLAPGARLLEVAAGTGEIGIELCRLGLSYSGFDLSAGMLDVFRERLASSGLAAELRRADGNERWPAPDGSTHAVFCSRAIQHLDGDHVLAELRRIAAPEGLAFLVGKVKREKRAVRAVMRDQMRELLERHGGTPGPGEGGGRRLLARCVEIGGSPIEAFPVARWPVRHAPADSLRSWRGKDGLAGADVPPALKAKVLDELERWAAERFGDLSAALESEETYVIEGAIVPGTRNG